MGQVVPLDLADIEPLVREVVSWSGMNERRLRIVVKKHLPGTLAASS
jgi:hypothetical protein